MIRKQEKMTIKGKTPPYIIVKAVRAMKIIYLFDKPN